MLAPPNSGLSAGQRQLQTAILAVSLILLSSVPISTVYADIIAEFKGSPGWALNLVAVAPNLMNMLATVVYGIFQRWMTPRRLALGTTVLLLAAGIMPIFGGGLVTVLVSRSIVGMCCGILAPLVTILAVGSFTSDEANRVMGLRAAAQGLGSMAMMFAAMLLASGGWRGAFGIYFLVLPVWIVLFRKLPAQLSPLSIENSRASNVNDAEPDGKPQPRSLFHIFWYVAAAFVYMACLNTLAPSLAAFLTEEGISAGTTSGVCMIAYMLGSLLCGLVYGSVSRITHPYTMVAGLAVTAAGIGVIALAHSLSAVTAGGVLQGVGFAVFSSAGVLEASHRLTGVMKRRVIQMVMVASGIGSFLSPFLADRLSLLIYGEIVMRNRFQLAACGGAILTVCMLIYRIFYSISEKHR